MLDLAKCFSHSRDLGFITDVRGVILAATSGTERALGFSQVELVGQDISHLDETGDLRRFFEALPVRSRMNLGFHLRTKPGAILAVNALATSLRNEAGEPVGWFLAAQDLQGAVGESRGAQPILDALIDSIGAVLWSFDRNGAVITWSRSCEAAFSIPREHAEGKLSAESLFASPEEYRKVVETVDRSGRFAGEVSLLGPGRALRPTHLSVTPLVSGGLPVGYTAVSIDLAERKRAEELTRTYFEQAGGAILVVDLETLRVVDANARASEMNGYPREELIGLPVSALRPPEAPDSDAAIVKALQEKGRYVNDRELARRKDGTLFPCAVDLRRITVGGKSYSVTVVQDLSAQRRAEEFQRILFHQAGEAILVVDAVTLRVLEANAKAWELHGYTREEFLGLHTQEIADPSGRPDVAEVARVLQTTGRYEGEGHVHRRKDGSTFPAAINLRQVSIGGRDHIIAVVRDLTEQRRAQEFQRILFERAGEAILVCDQISLQVMDVNARCCEMHGYTREEFLQLRIPAVVAPQDHRRMEAINATLAETGRYDGQQTLLRKDGSAFPCALNLRTVVLGDRVLTVSVYRDLTEQLKAQEFHRVLFEQAGEAIVVVEQSTRRILDANARACEMHGYTREEYLRLSIPDLIAPDQHGMMDAVGATLRETGRYDGQLLHRRKDASVFPCAVNLKTVLIGDRKLVVCVYRDLTELRKAEQFQRVLFQQAGEAIVVIDHRTLKIVDANDKAAELHGYARAEFLTLGVADYVAPVSQHEIQEVSRALEQHGTYEGRQFHRRKDGSLFPCSLNLKTVVGGDGNLVIAVHRDLTAELKAQEFFRVLFEKASDALYLVSDDGLRVVEANEAACRLLGYAREEFLKLAVVDLVPPPYRYRIPEFHASVRDGDGYRRDRRMLLRKNGTVVAVDQAVSRVEISGNPYYIAACRDLTEQERAARELEEAKASLERHVAERTAQLRESEERFRGAFAEGGIGMALVGLDGRFIQINRTLCEMLGYEERELRETTFHAITHPEDKEKSTDLARRMIQGQASARMVKRYLCRDGRVLWTDLSTTLLRDGAGAPLYFVTTIQDITEQKRAQEELERRVADRTAELARANAHLYEEIVERKRAENVLRVILEGTAAVTGGSFFRSLARHLASALNVRYAVVVQGVQQPKGRARTIAFWDGKEFIGPLDYTLAGTPCEDVMSGEACSYAHDAQRLFPEDRMLVDLGIQSYLGVPMVDSAGAVVGLLAVMDEKPISDEELKLSILKIFAARAGIELERQLAEEALRESEERWRSLVANAPDVILTVDREGHILSINRTVSGARISDVVGRRVQAYVPPDVAPRVNAALEKAFVEGKSSSYETLSMGPNGTNAWYITRVGPVKVGDQVTCATFIATDITERWKGEQRQKVQHMVTRVLAEASSLQDAAPRILSHFCQELDWQVGFLWWADPVANVLRFAEAWHAPNPGCEEFVNTSRLLTFSPGKGVLGLAWSGKEATWTPDLQEDARYFRPEVPAAAGLRTQVVLPVEGPRGVYGLLEFYSTEKRERDEALLQLASTVGSQIGQFIERRRAEEDLRFQKSLLESQTEAAIDGILVVSRDGVMTSFNRRFCQMWDIPEEVIESRTDERALQAVLDKLLDPKEFLDRVRHLYDHPDEESRDEVRLKDGRAFDRYSAPVKGGDGKHYGRVWYFRDITGRKQTEENLRRAAAETRQMYEDLKEAQAGLIRSEKLASIGMLVSGVAHEINNPLNVMYGNLQLLAEVSDVLLPLAVEGARARKIRGTASRVGKFRGMIRDALKAARHAREIVQDFRNFARDTRTAELVDLNQCLEEAVTLMQRELPPNIRVVRKLGRIPQVRCLRGQISQVFLNLLKNAGEAIEGKGTITLRTSQKDGYAVVEVADSGRGMPDEVRQKLFEPFFTTKPVGKGLGLGLSISAMIVHNHNGRITVRSRPGRGSVFRVELPLPV